MPKVVSNSSSIVVVVVVVAVAAAAAAAVVVIVRVTRDQHVLFFCLFVFQILFLAVIIRHGDDGKDEIDKVERTHEDDDDEKQHMKWSISAYHLKTRRHFHEFN